MASISDQQSADRPLTVLRSGRGLRGRFRVAPDPMLFSLAALLGALARGVTVLYHGAEDMGPSLAATRELLKAVGAPPEVSNDRWEINGMGPLGLLQPDKPLDFTGAREATPLALGLFGSYAFPTRLIGETAPGGAPLSPTINALHGIGVDIREQRTGRLPIGIHGPRTPVPFVARLPPAAAEAKAGLLLAALGLPGISTLVEPHPTPDHAERLLRHFGGSVIETTGLDGARSLAIAGLPALGARTLEIAGDADLATIALVAALIVPNSDVLIENFPLHPARLALLSTLEDMGGMVEILDRRLSAGEEVGDLRVAHSPLLGLAIEPRGLTPAAIPALAVAGAFAAGETHLPRIGFAGEAALHERLAAALAANG
ncbi:MAG: 3-phosphoshikimate 1-carboxyvinyltransferase, partial [Devosia sp.]|nr:3-phosphoshikimate 1-carboxyvinyltransferase [Devosia sp.]